MSCGKRVKLIKKWDRPRNIQVIKPSIYEKTPVAVKTYWSNIVNTLELSYKDEKFWESQSEKVRELVGPKIFRRLEKIFDLPPQVGVYEPKSDIIMSKQVSKEFYQHGLERKWSLPPPMYSATDFDASLYQNNTDEEVVEQESEKWSTSTDVYKSVTSNKVSLTRSRSSVMHSGSTKRSIKRTWSSVKPRRDQKASSQEASSYFDDLIVLYSGDKDQNKTSRAHNPHHHMLYCSKSETDMIKWNSKYKQKKLEVSASDEYSRKAKILTKTIAKEFYDWWEALGSVEFKSEIKREEDIEALFQVWFDEHASRELVLENKIIPCVLKSISEYVGIKKASCAQVLKKQIAYDIHAETKPAHTVAFATTLQKKLKHLPPKNNTQELWGPMPIPEDLKSMTCVWGDIQHLTSTKAFLKWIKLKPHLHLPPFLREMDKGGKKLLFTIPSDYVQTQKNESNLAALASKLSINLKEELSNLMF